jgi:hypothetical protein
MIINEALISISNRTGQQLRSTTSSVSHNRTWIRRCAGARSRRCGIPSSQGSASPAPSSRRRSRTCAHGRPRRRRGRTAKPRCRHTTPHSTSLPWPPFSPPLPSSMHRRMPPPWPLCRCGQLMSSTSAFNACALPPYWALTVHSFNSCVYHKCVSKSAYVLILAKFGVFLQCVALFELDGCFACATRGRKRRALDLGVHCTAY